MNRLDPLVCSSLSVYSEKVGLSQGIKRAHRQIDYSCGTKKILKLFKKACLRVFKTFANDFLRELCQFLIFVNTQFYIVFCGVALVFHQILTKGKPPVQMCSKGKFCHFFIFKF